MLFLDWVFSDSPVVVDKIVCLSDSPDPPALIAPAERCGKIVVMTGELFPEANLLPHDGEAVNRGVIFEAHEGDKIFEELMVEIPWAPDVIRMFGKTITTARKVAWMGDAGLDYTYSGKTKTPLPWTPLVLQLKGRVEQETGESFNSCLLNLYHHGEEGMSWHQDNESSIVPDSTIACLSFGAARPFHFKHLETRERITTVLEPGSLLTMSGPIQRFWQHALPKTKKVDDPRVSLTFRQMKTG